MQPNNEQFSSLPSVEARDNIAVEREFAIMQMQKQHAGTRLQDIGEMGYRKDSRSPMQILEEAGFLPDAAQPPAVSTKERLIDKGLVDFSLVPEAATIASVHNPDVSQYIYAAPIDKAYLVQNEKRQVLAPSQPTDFFVAREIIENNGAQAKLGPPIVIGNIPKKLGSDETFQAFLKTPSIAIPQDIALGDENYPAQYNIRDTPASSRLFNRGR